MGRPEGLYQILHHHFLPTIYFKSILFTNNRKHTVNFVEVDLTDLIDHIFIVKSDEPKNEKEDELEKFENEMF